VSTMDEGKRQKRPRRSFTDDFKAGAVRLVLDEENPLRRSLVIWT
jgi:transposase-like protein